MIGWFDGTEYDFLSNFHEHPVVTPFGVFRTGEHYFQWHKAASEKDRQRIAEAPSPGEAKRLGRTIKLRRDWEISKIQFMASVLSAKFSDPEMAALLLSTYPHELVEGNSWHDNIWGNCACRGCANIKGTNHLGKLLMGLRDHML